MMRFIVVVIILMGNALANDEEYVNEYRIYRDAVQFVETCGLKDLSVCLKERALKYIDGLPSNLDLGGGFKIKQNEPSRAYRERIVPLVLPEEARAREAILDNVLTERITSYIRSHSLEFKVPDEALTEVDKEVEEGRKRKGGGGGGMRMRPMLMLLQLKAAVLGAIALKFIGLIAFKALLISKIALTIASVISLKKLVEHKHHTSTYEVVAHPYDDHSHYDRSFNQETALRGSQGARSDN